MVMYVGYPADKRPHGTLRRIGKLKLKHIFLKLGVRGRTETEWTGLGTGCREHSSYIRILSRVGIRGFPNQQRTMSFSSSYLVFPPSFISIATGCGWTTER
jgi:hypothetical protein